MKRVSGVIWSQRDPWEANGRLWNHAFTSPRPILEGKKVNTADPISKTERGQEMGKQALKVGKEMSSLGGF
jgi:hypothetical protein